MEATAKKKCFIISPIGDEGSEIRKLADDFLELIVEPALGKYAFDVIRGDRIANSSAITSDIVRLVQESDLCIIDLTSSNPNVFYECGRRHETGRPFIQMVRRSDDTTLPFDVAGIRTLSYDISSPRAVLESQKKLQDFIDTLISSGFEAGTSGESLSSIAQALERIERKLNALITAPLAPSIVEEEDDDSIDISDILASPRKMFIRALRKNDIDRALSYLPRIEKTTSKAEYIATLALAVTVGGARAYEMMDQILQEIMRNPGAIEDRADILKVVSQAYTGYYTNTGNMSEGITVLDDLSASVLASDAFDNETKAFVVNKVGMLAWQANAFSKCIQATKLALSLNQEPSYAYNLAIVYDHQNMTTELTKALDMLSRMTGLDNDHRRLLKEHGIPIRATEQQA